MKLRNKKTGKIGEIGLYSDCDGSAIAVISNIKKDEDEWKVCHSLAELNEEWEDYEEPKEIYFISSQATVEHWPYREWEKWDKERSIGNYFETKEEAEKAVEKLKAWKRLRDNGFTIRQWRHTPDMNLTTGSFINIKGFIPEVVKNMKDLDLLFGGEE